MKMYINILRQQKITLKSNQGCHVINYSREEGPSPLQLTPNKSLLSGRKYKNYTKKSLYTTFKMRSKTNLILTIIKPKTLCIKQFLHHLFVPRQNIVS